MFTLIAILTGTLALGGMANGETTTVKAVAPSGIVIPKGGVLRITNSDQLPEVMDILVIQDGGQLVLDFEAAQPLKLTARQAWFGANAKILARGAPGGSARGVGVRGANGAECRSARAGGPGPRGKSGGHGHKLTLELGVVMFGGLVIDVSGGPGGRGGAGGAGGVGGIARVASKADLCSGGAGGPGGRGGQGGNGGKGGDVKLNWWDASGAVDSPTDDAKVSGWKVITAGGAPGAGGPGGSGSPGGGGVCKKFLFKICKGGGPHGPNGGAGPAGRAGTEGAFEITRMPR